MSMAHNREQNSSNVESAEGTSHIEDVISIDGGRDTV